MANISGGMKDQSVTLRHRPVLTVGRIVDLWIRLDAIDDDSGSVNDNAAIRVRIQLDCSSGPCDQPPTHRVTWASPSTVGGNCVHDQHRLAGMRPEKRKLTLGIGERLP